MAIERTFSIIKPDAVAKNVVGEIYSRFEKAGLKIIAAKMLHLSKEQAEGFYAVHKERPFFKDLVEFMTSGPVMVQVLEGENAITQNRDAKVGSIGRRRFNNRKRIWVVIWVSFDVLNVHRFAVDECPTHYEGAVGSSRKNGVVRCHLFGRHLVYGDKVQESSVELRDRTECRITKARCVGNDCFENRLN